MAVWRFIQSGGHIGETAEKHWIYFHLGGNQSQERQCRWKQSDEARLRNLKKKNAEVSLAVQSDLNEGYMKESKGRHGSWHRWDGINWRTFNIC